MQARNRLTRWRGGLAALALAIVVGAAPHGAALAQQENQENVPARIPSIYHTTVAATHLPRMNAVKGMLLFATKGCVACHQVNGIGGKVGPALDAHQGGTVIRPLEIAAKMWGSAKKMIAAQEKGLGQQVKLNEEELGHIIAFLYDGKRQQHFDQALLPVRTRELIKRVGGRLEPIRR